MAIPETLGERIQQALNDAGKTQTWLASTLGKSRNTVGLWVTTSRIPEEELERVADVLGRSRAWLRYGVLDPVEEGIERYVTGWEEAVEKMRENLDRMQPPVREAKPLRTMRSGDEEQDPLEPPIQRKRHRRA